MKKLLLAALLAVPLFAGAATQHEDGSITLSRDEKEETENMINHLLRQQKLMMLERTRAKDTIKEMQRKIESLQSAKCI